MCLFHNLIKAESSEDSQLWVWVVECFSAFIHLLLRLFLWAFSKTVWFGCYLKWRRKISFTCLLNQIRIAINSILCVAANVKSFPWLRSLISTGDCAESTAMINQSLQSSESPLAWLCWGGSNLLLIRRAARFSLMPSSMWVSMFVCELGLGWIGSFFFFLKRRFILHTDEIVSRFLVRHHVGLWKGSCRDPYWPSPELSPASPSLQQSPGSTTQISLVGVLPVGRSLLQPPANQRPALCLLQVNRKLQLDIVTIFYLRFAGREHLKCSAVLA